MMSSQESGQNKGILPAISAAKKTKLTASTTPILDVFFMNALSPTESELAWVCKVNLKMKPNQETKSIVQSACRHEVDTNKLRHHII